MKGSEMKPPLFSCLGIGILLLTLPYGAEGCSCSWNGPFFTVSRSTPLAIRCKILRQPGGASPIMDILVQETLKGGLLDSGMVVHMGDGVHCRPPCDGLPPVSEWILALNGPGSKPGNGWALPPCGQYWLRVSDGDEIERGERFAKGWLDNRHVVLQEGVPCLKIGWMDFSVRLEGES